MCFQQKKIQVNSMIQIYFSLVQFMVLSVSDYTALNGTVSGEW
jgi:hypothetical protein